MIRLLSPLRSTVWKIRIESTVPATPCASIQSPTLNGRNSRISTPPAKLARLPCRARPMARPAAPMAATKLVVWMPIMEATLTTSRIFRTMLTRLPTKPCRVRSTLRLASRPPTRPVRVLISHQPIARVSSARATLPLYSSTIGSQDSVCCTSRS